MKSLRVRDILEISEEVLRKKEIENPRLNAELLLASVLNTERINLYLDFERLLAENEISSYREKIRRRLNREPLQYILGYCEFYGMRFSLTPDVLIPRPETEILVEESIERISALQFTDTNEGLLPRLCGDRSAPRKSPEIRILEIGTGSGCISIALGANCKCIIDAIDESEKALKVAAENAGAYELKGKINFQKRNIFTSFDSFEGYDIVISNPPYITADEFELLPDEIKKYEPKNALTDEKDGLTYYKKIIELALKTKNRMRCLVEIGDGKRERVEEILKDYGINNYQFFNDLMSKERVLEFNVN